MWNRIRGKILAKQVVGIGHVDAQLVDIVDRCALTETGQMQAVIDKCSCGSPRLGSSKMAPHSHTDAAIVTSLNRKLDAGSVGSPLLTAKNEYTKPTISKTSSGTVDDRRRTSTNSGHTGNATTTQGRRDEANNVKNAQLQRQQRKVDGSPHHATHAPSNVNGEQQTANEQFKHQENRSDSDKNQTKKFEKDEDNSNYTSLNYDVNYVRVAPPKMTRRPKRSESSSATEPEVKLTREAQLLASRMAAAVEAGTLPSEKRGCREPRAPAPGPETVKQASLDGDSSGGSSKLSNGSETVTSDAPAAAHVTSNIRKEAVTTKPLESDYMSLVDLQSRLSGTHTTQSVCDDTLTGSGGQAQKPEVVRREQDTSSASAIKTTMYNDGESSFLQFTFTVRLDNDVTSRPSPSVVSGTVNIVQPSVSRDSGVVEDMVDDGDAMKPVVTVGLQQGGSVVMVTGNNEHQTAEVNDDEGFDCVDGDIGTHHVIKVVMDKNCYFNCVLLYISQYCLFVYQINDIIPLEKQNRYRCRVPCFIRFYLPDFCLRVQMYIILEYISINNSISGVYWLNIIIAHVKLLQSKQLTNETESIATDTESTMYHSLLANDRQACRGLNGTYEGFHQQNEADESIHMSWDEVINS